MIRSLGYSWNLKYLAHHLRSSSSAARVLLPFCIDLACSTIVSSLHDYEKICLEKDQRYIQGDRSPCLGMSPLSRLQILSYSYSLGTQIASISCQLWSFGCERSNVLRKKPTKSQGTSSILRYVYIYLFANFVVEIIYWLFDLFIYIVKVLLFFLDLMRRSFIQ